jgi:hypothetical protein
MICPSRAIAISNLIRGVCGEALAYTVRCPPALADASGGPAETKRDDLRTHRQVKQALNR